MARVMKHIPVYLDEDLIKALKARAREWHVGVSTAIRLIIAREVGEGKTEPNRES